MHCETTMINATYRIQTDGNPAVVDCSRDRAPQPVACLLDLANGRGRLCKPTAVLIPATDQSRSAVGLSKSAPRRFLLLALRTI